MDSDIAALCFFFSLSLSLSLGNLFALAAHSLCRQPLTFMVIAWFRSQAWSRDAARNAYLLRVTSEFHAFSPNQFLYTVSEIAHTGS